MTSIAKNIEENSHPLFTPREEVKNILLVFITSNRGLCGAYNAQIIKKVISLFKNTSESTKISLVTIGKKGDTGMRRLGQKVVASFMEFSDNVLLGDVLPISKLLIDDYKALKYDQVLVAYTDFISALTQKPNIKQILPINKAILREFIDDLSTVEKEAETENKNKRINYLVEGDMNTLIGSLAEKIIRMQVYQMLLESNASEQSSRMVAMKNASEASGEMIDDLTLMFNKARQANITREISEISAGMASVS